MKDFASYTGPDGTREEWLDEARKFADGYAGKGENELLRDIYARAVEGKRNGTLTNEQIDAFYARFSPMLDGAKRKKLARIVERLKNM